MRSSSYENEVGRHPGSTRLHGANIPEDGRLHRLQSRDFLDYVRLHSINMEVLRSAALLHLFLLPLLSYCRFYYHFPKLMFVTNFILLRTFNFVLPDMKTFLVTARTIVPNKKQYVFLHSSVC